MVGVPKQLLASYMILNFYNYKIFYEIHPAWVKKSIQTVLTPKECQWTALHTPALAGLPTLGFRMAPGLRLLQGPVTNGINSEMPVRKFSAPTF